MSAHLQECPISAFADELPGFFSEWGIQGELFESGSGYSWVGGHQVGRILPNELIMERDIAIERTTRRTVLTLVTVVSGRNKYSYYFIQL